MSYDSAPDDRRETLWFECVYCDKTWHKDSYNEIRHVASAHLNEEHGDDLQHSYERVETETRDGHHIHENTYAMTRIDIYVTPFDVLQPAIGRPWDLVAPSDSDRVCKRCGQRVSHTSDTVEMVEDEPDNLHNDDWTCSTCLDEQDVNSRYEENYQLEDFAVTN